MRRLALALYLACAFAPPAGAQPASQDPNVIAVPPAPAITAAPSSVPLPAPPPEASAPPPGLVQTPLPPAAAAPAGAAPQNADNGTAAIATTAPSLDSTWQPGRTAKLGVLNKVDGSVSELDIPVGGQATAGDLTLNVLACVNRPAGQIPDAAVFINAQDSSGTALTPVYRGWMVRSAPGAAVVGDAGETFRVIDCS